MPGPMQVGHRGSGLGLTYCRRVLEALGGPLTLSSRPGLGSTFSFTVPLADTAAPAPAAHSAHGADRRRRSAVPRRGAFDPGRLVRQRPGERRHRHDDRRPRTHPARPAAARSAHARRWRRGRTRLARRPPHPAHSAGGDRDVVAAGPGRPGPRRRDPSGARQGRPVPRHRRPPDQRLRSGRAADDEPGDAAAEHPGRGRHRRLAPGVRRLAAPRRLPGRRGGDRRGRAGPAQPQPSFDLVLLDIHLPDMSGLRRLRPDQGHPGDRRRSRCCTCRRRRSAPTTARPR